MTGCWTSSSPPPQEPPKPPPPDAAPDSQIEPELVGEIDLSGPALPPPITTPAGCPTGRGMTATIRSASVVSGRTVVTLDAGTSQGLTPQWSIGGPAGCAVMRLEQTRTIAVCGGTTPAQVTGATAVLCDSPLVPPPPTNLACPSGRGRDGRILAVRVNNADVEIVVAGGSDQGIAATWLVLQPACTIQRVDRRTTTATCANTSAQAVGALPRAILCAP